MPRLTSIKDHRLIGAASRTGSLDRVYTLIEYKRTPATIVDTKPTMKAASTAYLSLLDVFLRDHRSGNGRAKISISEATVNEFVAVRISSQMIVLHEEGFFDISWLTIEECIDVDASPRQALIPVLWNGTTLKKCDQDGRDELYDQQGYRGNACFPEPCA